MGKGRCTFKGADVTRAAGLDVQVAIDWERKRMTITPVKTGDLNTENEWDEVFDNGDDQASVR